MKAELVVEKTPKAFVPRIIKIKLESEDDVRNLWHRLNLCLDDLASANPSDDMELPCGEDTYGAWNIVDELAIDLGLKKGTR